MIEKNDLLCTLMFLLSSLEFGTVYEVNPSQLVPQKRPCRRRAVVHKRQLATRNSLYRLQLYNAQSQDSHF